MNFIQPIGPVERDVDPVRRVERAKDEEQREQQEQRKRKQGGQGTGDRGQDPTPDGPVEGDDGHLHIDIRA
jgi:hypothetical protein